MTQILTKIVKAASIITPPTVLDAVRNLDGDSEVSLAVCNLLDSKSKSESFTYRDIVIQHLDKPLNTTEIEELSLIATELANHFDSADVSFESGVAFYKGDDSIEFDEFFNNLTMSMINLLSIKLKYKEDGIARSFYPTILCYVLLSIDRCFNVNRAMN